MLYAERQQSQKSCFCSVGIRPACSVMCRGCVYYPAGDSSRCLTTDQRRHKRLRLIALRTIVTLRKASPDQMDYTWEFISTAAVATKIEASAATEVAFPQRLLLGRRQRLASEPRRLARSRSDKRALLLAVGNNRPSAHTFCMSSALTWAYSSGSSSTSAGRPLFCRCVCQHLLSILSFVQRADPSNARRRQSSTSVVVARNLAAAAVERWGHRPPRIKRPMRRIRLAFVPRRCRHQ